MMLGGQNSEDETERGGKIHVCHLMWHVGWAGAGNGMTKEEEMGQRQIECTNKETKHCSSQFP